MIGCIIVVIGFQTSSRLAAAYGIAVTSTMVITTLLLYFVARDRWKWSFLPTASLCLLFLIIDSAFFGANLIKLFDGGWFTLTLAAAMFLLMMTWKKVAAFLTREFRKRLNSWMNSERIEHQKSHAFRERQFS